MLPDQRSPRRGYVLAAAAAALWAVNASLARYLLDDGVSALRLAQLRSLLSWLILLAVIAAFRPRLLRIAREDVPRLAFLGIAGLALVHATYFLAIQRLQIGAALTIEYLAPLLVLIWLRVAHGRRLRPSLWAAAALSLAGCFFVVRGYRVASLDGLGIAAAFGSAVTYAIYIVGSERSGRRYSPVTTLVWAFGFATAFWALAQPLWDFPFGRFASLEHLALGLGVAVIGTVLPFACIVAAVRHIPASRASVVATLEPALAAAVAWAVHGEALAGVQIAGGLAVIAAIVWVQAQALSFEDEAAPAYSPRTARASRPLSRPASQ